MSKIESKSPDGRKGYSIECKPENGSKGIWVQAHYNEIHFGLQHFTLQRFLFLLGITMEDVAAALYGNQNPTKEGSQCENSRHSGKHKPS